MEIIEHLSRTLELEIEWFQKAVNASLTLYFNNEIEINSIYDISPPEIEESPCPYGKFIRENNLSFDERLVLVLGLAPLLKPNSLDVFLIKNQNLNTDFSEFGGYKIAAKNGFFPSLETACFIVGGYQLEKRLHFLNTFHKDHLFFKQGVLEWELDTDFLLVQKLLVSNEYIGLFTSGAHFLPEYSTTFPAKEIKTELKWSDLVVSSKVKQDLDEIKDWLIHSKKILLDWNLKQNFKAGYRALFYGPPGTGKTFAASLLGKETGQPVFRVDLSLVVSKYIGETEKNLGKLFDVAENKDWILFFDEADALFGKRTHTKGANDRYANQEVAYLLQRIEDFAGLVILATNIETNIDEAFTRRFQTMVHFPVPGKSERKLLWEKMFMSNFELEASIDIGELAEKYELTGGEMNNILRYCALEAARRDEKKLLFQDIMAGIRREYHKQNKTL